MLHITLAPKDWITLLNDFQKACKKGRYKKIDYDIWRDFTNINEFDDGNVILEQSELDWVRVISNVGHYVFNRNDKALGSYLFNNWDSVYEFNMWTKAAYSTIEEAADIAGVKVNGKPIVANDEIIWITDNNNNEKENNKMKNIVNFDFGPLSNSQVRISMYGLAVKNTTGTFVSYDANTQTLMDVDVLNFEGKNLLYKMPVAIKDIKIGDIVIHNTKPMFVVGTGEDGKTLKVIDPVTGEKKEILLLRSPFGFDFATKIVNLAAGAFNTAATPDNPFGNAWMWMLMGDEAANTDNLLPFFMMNGNTNIDPMMMYCLMSHDSNNLLPLFMMSQMNQPHVCTCGCHCGDTEAK